MEAKAISRHNRQSARKMRMVIDLIRGQRVDEAYAILQFSKKKAADTIDKTLRSAVATRYSTRGCGAACASWARSLVASATGSSRTTRTKTRRGRVPNVRSSADPVNSRVQLRSQMGHTQSERHAACAAPRMTSTSSSR